MKNKWCAIGVVLVCLLSLGMGGSGEDSVVSIPKTDKNFVATLVDQADVSMQLEHFSFDGMTFLTGKFGKSDISIDFEKIDSVAFLLHENVVKAGVRLKDGQLVEIMIDRNKPCFGSSSFAHVRIEVADIKKVSLRLKE